MVLNYGLTLVLCLGLLAAPPAASSVEPDDEQSLMGLRSMSKVLSKDGGADASADRTFPFIPGPDHGNDALCKRVDKIEIQLNITTDIAVSNKQKIEVINKNINDISNDISNKNDNFLKQVSDLSNKIDTSQENVQDQITKLKNDISTSQSQTQDQITDLRNRMSSTQSSMQDQINSLKSQISSSTSSSNSQDQSNGVNVEIKQASHDVQGVKAHMQSVQSQQSTQQMAADVEIRQLQQQMAELRAIVLAPGGGRGHDGNQVQVTKQATNVEQSVEVSQMQKQISDLTAELRQFQSQASEQSVTAVLRSDVRQVQLDIVEIKNKLVSLQVQIDHMGGSTGLQLLIVPIQTQIADLEAKLSAVQSQSSSQSMDSTLRNIEKQELQAEAKAQAEQEQKNKQVVKNIQSQDTSVNVEVRQLQQDMAIVKSTLVAFQALFITVTNQNAVQTVQNQISQVSNPISVSSPQTNVQTQSTQNSNDATSGAANKNATSLSELAADPKRAMAQIESNLAALTGDPRSGARSSAGGGASLLQTSSLQTEIAQIQATLVALITPGCDGKCDGKCEDASKAPSAGGISVAGVDAELKSEGQEEPAAAAATVKQHAALVETSEEHFTPAPSPGPVTIPPGTLPPTTTSTTPSARPCPPLPPCPFPPCPPPPCAPCPYPPCPPPPCPCGGGFNGDININVTGPYIPYPPPPLAGGPRTAGPILAETSARTDAADGSRSPQRREVSRLGGGWYPGPPCGPPCCGGGFNGDININVQAYDPYCVAFAARMVDTKWLVVLELTAKSECKKAALAMKKVESEKPSYPPCATYGYEERLKQLQSAYPGCPPPTTTPAP